ncbi:MAG: hypothetical protein R2812_06585 [Gelidibacter sp.]
MDIMALQRLYTLNGRNWLWGLSNSFDYNDTIAYDLLNIGKEMINKPVELLDGVEKVLHTLSSKYRLIVVTKGDLLDQERKLQKSIGIVGLFSSY